MIHRDFVLIETPAGVVRHVVRVITQMSTKERLDAIRERPDLIFKVIGADEKDVLMGADKPTVDADKQQDYVTTKGISVHGLSLPVDLEKMIEEL
jgi:hypothetical protein